MSRRFLSLIAFLVLGGGALAQTITVPTDDDLIDVDPRSATVADLPGPDGKVSFSEALIASNHTPGRQTIAFAIPTSDWNLQFLYPGRAVLTTVVGYYWSADDPVTIDATTQTAFTGDTNPYGNEVVADGPSIRINADGCVLRGFDNSSISVSGALNVVEDNTLVNVSLFGGGGSIVQRNTGGTIKIDRSDDNVVIGNTVNRVRVLGVLGFGQPARNNRVGGPAAGDRNFITGYGAYNSEGLPSGSAVQLFDTVGTLVENNRIGTTPDGMAQGNSACTIGVSIEGDNQGLVVRGNQISGILAMGMGHWAGALFGRAVLVSGTGADLEILGNQIGLDAAGDPVLGSVDGIDIGSAVTHPSMIDDIRIGGVNPGEGNVIGGHRGSGVVVGGSADQVRVRGTSFRANSRMAIDLVPPTGQVGATPNDPLDADTGANGLQNHPVLASAQLAGSGTRVSGALDSSPAGNFTLDFYASPSAGANGRGQGELWLGSLAVGTDSNGHAAFDQQLPVAAPAGWLVSATATLEPTGETSEFSPEVALSALELALSGNLIRGTAVDAVATSARGGETVWFLYGTTGLGNGPCPPQLGGLCLDLLAPVRILGSAAADAGGRAVLGFTVPAGAPTIPVHFQAVAARGAGSVKSAPLTAPVL